jgi:transcriptional regulator with XRE-family HTH domain
MQLIIYFKISNKISRRKKMIEFKDRLKELRKEKSLTQEELAKQFYLNKSSISRYERGQQIPEIELLQQIADFFSVSVDYLLARTNDRNPYKDKPSLPEEFTSPEEAIKFILNQNVIMGFGGFDVNTMSDEEVLEFANELLNQLRILSYKYKK